MTRIVPFAVLAAAAALSACSTVGHAASHVWPFGDHNAHAQPAAPQEGRISILSFEQQLTADPSLAGHTIVPPAAVDTPNWSEPGGVASNAPVHIAGPAALEVGLRQSLGAGSSRHVHLAAPPVVSDGHLYFLDAEHQISAYDASTGARIWSHRLRETEGHDKEAVGGGVAAEAGRVFVVTGFGFVVALDGQTGAEVWRRQADAPFHGAPTVAGGRVYAVTNDSELVAINAGSGEVEWTYQAIAEPARILAASSPAVDGDTVIAPFASGEVVALLAANGRRLWVDSPSRAGRLTSLSAINDIAGRPVVETGVVYAASHSGLLAAIDLRTGQRIWSKPFASTQTPWIAGDVLYAVNTDGELAAFDRTNGNVYWIKQLPRYEHAESSTGRIAWTGPIMVGGKLILASSSGQVIAVAPETGEIATTRELGKPIFIPPIAAGGAIYLVTDEARLIVLH